MKATVYEYLYKLLQINATSGNEKPVRDYVIEHIGDCEYKTDALGSLIVFKKGTQRAKNKVMLDAHMDEVGIMVRYICDDGLLKFITVGGISEKVLVGRTVVFDSGIIGAVCIKPIHLSSGDERNKIPDIDELYIDIGAGSHEEAEKLVSPGDTAVFDAPLAFLGEHKILSKALDDRIGCAIMLDMINSDLPYDAYFSFSVQEEVGLRGAACSAFGVAPDYAIVLEGTTAADIAGVADDKRVCIQGEGAAVSFMDRSTVYNPELYEKAFELAKENCIKIQTKTLVAGGNNAGAIHRSGTGVKVLSVNVPCRYIHSGSSVADRRDIDSACELAHVLLEYMANV